MLPTPSFSLDAPDTFVFTVDDAWRGRAVNRFAADLRSPARRAAFAADERAVLADSGLPADVVAMIEARDWTGLIRAGAHLQLLLFVGAPVGCTLWDLGAHAVGCTAAELMDACPRDVHGLPAAMPGG